MVRHELKTWPGYFEAVVSGEKTFEIRENDRDFQVGDTLVLREWVTLTGQYSGRKHEVEVTYITELAQKDGYVVMGINSTKQAIENVIEDLKKRRIICKHHKDQSAADAFLYAITSLKEVLANEDRNTRNPPKPE